jgi:EpsI family protein
MKNLWSWTPAGLFALGAVLTYGGIHRQEALPLRMPLKSAVPSLVAGMPSTDHTISEAEQRVAGMDNYLMRIFTPAGASAAEAVSVYVGYYKQQSQGHTIHSPKNCLPGSGWEPLTAAKETVATAMGPVHVNRYLIANGASHALVLYWYQGRGRTESNEYVVKWNLLRDQALRGRSDEALVRVIVPVESSEAVAHQKAVQMARVLAPSVQKALPI